MKITNLEFYQKLRPLLNKKGMALLWFDRQYLQVVVRLTQKYILRESKRTYYYNLIKKSIDNLKI